MALLLLRMNIWMLELVVVKYYESINGYETLDWISRNFLSNMTTRVLSTTQRILHNTQGLSILK